MNVIFQLLTLALIVGIVGSSEHSKKEKDQLMMTGQSS